MSRSVVYHVIAIILIIIGVGCADNVEETTPPTIMPVAVAGADIIVNAGVTITLDGSGSTSVRSPSYRWVQISGPIKPSLIQGTLTTMTVNIDTPIVTADTTWLIELTVDDGTNTATDQIEITVNHDITAPGIVSRDPDIGELNVLTTTAIEIVFNEALKVTDELLSNSIVLTTDTSVEPYDGTISYIAIADDAENKSKLRFDLHERLPNNTLFTVSLSSDIQDAAGNKRGPEQWDFTTVESSNASLSDLRINGVALIEPFQYDKMNYTANAGYLTQSIRVLATTVDDNATFTVNEIDTPSGQESAAIALAEGSDTIVEVTVTAADATTQLTYSIKIFRQSANDFAQAYIKAANTGAGDNFGFSVALSGDTLAVGAYLEDSNATGVNCNGDDTDLDDNGILDCYEDDSLTDSGAVYVFTRSGGIWTLQAYIKADNTGERDRFGNSVALSGDTLVVGAYFEDSNATGPNCIEDDIDKDGNGILDCYEDDSLTNNSGAVYVFTRSGGIWTLQAYIKADNTGARDNFGSSVALSGDTLVVGAIGEDSNARGANTAATGADDGFHNSSGAVYVFKRTGSTWEQQAYIKADNTGAGDFFGASVALSGDTLAVGAQNEDSNAVGISPNSESSKDASGGAPIDGTLSTDAGYDSGAVYVFKRNGNAWDLQAYVKADNAGALDYFGTSVALSGDTLAVGAYLEDSNAVGISPNSGSSLDASGEKSTDGTLSTDAGFNSGAVYVFKRTGSTWDLQAYVKADNTGAGDKFGISVALSGDILAVGAIWEDSNASGVSTTATGKDDGFNNNSGAVYVFNRTGNTWAQQVYIKASNTGLDDWFGTSVALSGDTLAVGASLEDSNATGPNCIEDNIDVNPSNGILDCYEDNSLSNSGAVYVFH